MPEFGWYDCWFFVFQYTFAPQRFCSSKVMQKMTLFHSLQSCPSCKETQILVFLKHIMTTFLNSADRIAQKEKCFSWKPHIQRKHFSLTPDALVRDPWRTSPWPPTNFYLTPQRAFPWPLMPFSFTWRAYLAELKVKKEKKL